MKAIIWIMAYHKGTAYLLIIFDTYVWQSVKEIYFCVYYLKHYIDNTTEKKAFFYSEVSKRNLQLELFRMYIL